MRPIRSWVAAAFLLPAAIARGQEPLEETQEPDPTGEEPVEAVEPVETELSPEDLAAIEEATRADAEALAEAQPEPDPVPPATAAGTQSMNPDLSFIADFALAWFSDDDEVLQTGAHDPTETGFTLQQLELAVGAAVDPYFRFDANLVFTLFGVEIEEAYATTLGLPAALQVRLGQFLTAFGRINGTHPHAWHFADQPFAIGRVFGGEGNRGLGVELSWLTPLPWYVLLVGSVTGAAGDGTARSFFGEQDLGIDGPLDLQYTAAIEQFFPFGDDLSLFWGLSGAFGPNPTGRDNRTEIYGTDLYLKWRPITEQSDHEVHAQAELLYRRRQIPLDVLQDLSGYAQLFVRFAQRWGAAARYEWGSPVWDLDGVRAGDYLDPFWDGHRHRASLSLTHDPTEFSRLRLQASADVPDWLPDPVWAVFLQTEFVTGAHGSHSY